MAPSTTYSTGCPDGARAGAGRPGRSAGATGAPRRVVPGRCVPLKPVPGSTRVGPVLVPTIDPRERVIGRPDSDPDRVRRPVPRSTVPPISPPSTGENVGPAASVMGWGAD